jgi:hypothetical protein
MCLDMDESVHVANGSSDQALTGWERCERLVLLVEQFGYGAGGDRVAAFSDCEA